MAAINTQVVTTGAGSTTLNVPAQPVVVGDLIMIWCAVGFPSITWIASGFTAVPASSNNSTGQHSSCQLLYRTADSTDVSLWQSTGSYTVTISTFHAWDAVIIISGQADPALSGLANSGSLQSSSTSLTANSITTSQSGDVLVWLGVAMCASGSTPLPITVPAGYTQLGIQLNSSGVGTANTGMTIATANQSSPGATGAVSGSISAAQGTGGLLIGVQPATQPVAQPGSVVQSAAGAPTQTAFTVVSKLSNATSLRLKVATDAALTQNVTWVSAQTPDGLNYVRHVVTGLSAGTQYYYQLADTPSGGSETLIGSVGKAKTLPSAGTPQNFRVALVSCITQATTDPAAINDWTAWNADLNVFTGDFDYSGTKSTDLSTQVGVYETQIANSVGLNALIANAWGYYCRSDHEAGPDNGDSDNTYTATNIAAYQQVFPYGALGDSESPPHGLYQTWVAGRVRFIMIDIRNIDRSPGSNTDDASKTMLGATQMAWFKAQLIQPEPLKVIVSDVAWMGAPSITNGPDKWWSYSTERQAIISYIAANTAQVQNVMLWHGDSHCVGVATPAQNTWGGFPVYCAAPMHNTGGGRDLTTFSAYYDNDGGDCRQYGRITFTDDGTTITSTFSGWDATNQVEQVSQTDTFNAPSSPTGKGRAWNEATQTWQTFTPKIYEGGTPVTAETKIWDETSGTWKITSP
jgi:alkaline phosphatase D